MNEMFAENPEILWGTDDSRMKWSFTVYSVFFKLATFQTKAWKKLQTGFKVAFLVTAPPIGFWSFVSGQTDWPAHEDAHAYCLKLKSLSSFTTQASVALILCLPCSTDSDATVTGNCPLLLLVCISEIKVVFLFLIKGCAANTHKVINS